MRSEPAGLHPHHEAIDAEEQIVGSLLREPQMLVDVAARVLPQDFVDQPHSAAYAAMMQLYRAGEPIDTVMLVRRLRDDPLFPMETVATYLANIAGRAVPGNLLFHCRRVSEAAHKRELMRFSEQTREMSIDDKSSGEMLAAIREDLDELDRRFAASNPDATDAVQTSDRIVRDYIDRTEQGIGEIIETGIEAVDDALSGGVCYGEMVIIAGRPSHGKTMTGLHILDSLCERGHECLLLSEEMGKTMIAQRFLHRITSVGSDQWKYSIDQLRSDVDEWADGRAPCYIAPPCGTVKKAVSMIDNAARRGVRIVAVDYLQLLWGGGQGKYEQTSDVSQRLREAASRHDLLLFCLAQLSRKSEDHEGAPKLSDLRDSGQLEQDADVVMFVDWPRLRGEPVAGDVFYVRIRKNRNRDTATQDVKLRVDRRRQTLSTPSIEEVYEWKPSE